VTPISATQTIGSKRYSTDNSTLLGDDSITMLFRTPNGHYFGQKSDGILFKLDLDDAIDLFLTLVPTMSFWEAFPGITIQDA
jgi:hypothetical protein